MTPRFAHMQFTQILDILQTVLKHASIKFLLLTGQTPVDERQGLVDEFTDDDSIMVFLLSTKAGKPHLYYIIFSLKTGASIRARAPCAPRLAPTLFTHFILFLFQVEWGLT